MDDFCLEYCGYILEALRLDTVWPGVNIPLGFFGGMIKVLLMVPLLAVTSAIPLGFVVAIWWWVLKCWAGKPLE